jgi:hypothetical protein
LPSIRSRAAAGRSATCFDTPRWCTPTAWSPLARRWYRRLEYTTDCRFSYQALQPQYFERQRLWPKWGRFEAWEDQFENTLQQLAPPAYPNTVEVCRAIGLTGDDEAADDEDEKKDKEKAAAAADGSAVPAEGAAATTSAEAKPADGTAVATASVIRSQADRGHCGRCCNYCCSCCCCCCQV